MELNSEKEVFDGGQWLHDFEEYAERSSKERKQQFQDVKEMGLQLVAKAQAIVERGEIYRQQVQKRLDEGEWDRCRGLPREQQREVLTQIYCEELVAKMQQDALNQTITNWQEHRLRRIELIQWSQLPDSEKKKWLEFYNKPSPNLNLSEGEYHADQT